MFDLEGIQTAVDTVTEPIVWEETEEVQVKVVGCASGKDKNGFAYILPRFALADEVGYKTFTKFLSLPDTEMDAEKKQNSALNLKRFCQCFELEVGQMFDADGVVEEEYLKSATGWVTLGIEETEKYGKQNYISRMISGPDE